ncbi:excinuclease ABC subunit UvrC [Bacteroidota bacterium]
MNLKESDTNNTLESLVEVLPNKPGVYQYFDSEGKILYVGKARDLKKRVSSYFTKSKTQSFKQHVLVKKIADIKHVVVSSESDALLLENNLIKKLQPRYNVLLKDDKTFPWICVKNEPFPRIFYTRNVVKDGSVYYGPYTSVLMVRTIIEMARQLFPLRNCRLNLSKENIEKGNYKVCLEFHVGNCKAPCIGLQKEADYENSIEQVKKILSGNIKQVSEYLKTLMKFYAEEFKYEEAQIVKEKLAVLEKYRSKSTIVNPKIKNVDVFSIVEDKGYAFVNYLKVIEGAIVQAHTLEIKKKMEESREELLSLAIVDIRQKIQSDAREIILPFGLKLTIGDARFVVPQKGDKKHLLELSERNARHYKIERRNKIENAKTALKPSRVMETIRKDLHLKYLPTHIECFDNSNLQGSNPVAACVVFRNAKPSKRDYRHFHVKSVKGADDFASMQEIVFRRYSRLIEEKKGLPQLIIIDGGKGQLNAAVKSLEKLKIRGKIAVIGVAKRLEEIYFPGDKVPMYIDKNSETLKVIQQLRNEAHRFGISFHRKMREKMMTGSELDSINGIGEKTKSLLLTRFGSLEGVKAADIEEIVAVVGKSKAEILKNYFLRSTT